MNGRLSVLFLGFFLFFPFVQGAEIFTILGTGKAGFSGDGGPATKAKMRGPFGVVHGPDGCLYVCDTYNHCIRKIDQKGIVKTVAGTGGEKGYAGDGRLATEALLNEPYEVRFDQAGDLYFVEMMNHVIRKVDMKSGIISTIAGIGKQGFSGDGDAAIKAEFNRPHSIQFGPKGNLYVCDIGNHRIRKIERRTGKIFTFAGTGKKAPTKDGGKISEVYLKGPRAIDVAGNAMWLALREGRAMQSTGWNWIRKPFIMWLVPERRDSPEMADLPN